MTTKTAISDDAAHLLVVDDDTRIRALLNRYLMEKGYRVTTAADGSEARRKLEGARFRPDHHGRYDARRDPASR